MLWKYHLMGQWSKIQVLFSCEGSGPKCTFTRRMAKIKVLNNKLKAANTLNKAPNISELTK